MNLRLTRRAGIVGVLTVVALGIGGVAYAATSSNSVIHACQQKSGGALRIASSCTSSEQAISWNVQGPQGPVGLQGPRGDTGAKGATGLKGATGATGSKGSTGATGATGGQGPAGPAGDVGPAGPAGPAGSVGPAGDIGPAGPAGSVGPAGPAGAAGPLSGYQVVTLTNHTDFASNAVAPYIESVVCPTGQVAVGGGGTAYVEGLENNGEGEGAVLSNSFPVTNGSSWEAGFTPVGATAFLTTDQLDYSIYVICVDGTS